MNVLKMENLLAPYSFELLSFITYECIKQSNIF